MTYYNISFKSPLEYILRAYNCEYGFLIQREIGGLSEQEFSVITHCLQYQGFQLKYGKISLIDSDDSDDTKMTCGLKSLDTASTNTNETTVEEMEQQRAHEERKKRMMRDRWVAF